MSGMRFSAIPDTHGQLPSLSAYAAPEGDVRHTDAVASRSSGGRPSTVCELAEPRNCGEHRPTHQAIARVARHDAEPAAGSFARISLLFVPDRERSDDA